MSSKREHLVGFADAAYKWGVANADFAESSERLAAFLRGSAAHTRPDAPQLAVLIEMAERLDRRAGDAREDALDIGELAATLRAMVDGD